MTELRQTFRRLAATPGFTTVVVLTLGLGIGVNTAIFSAVHRLLIDPLPFEDGDRLAFVWRQAVNSPMMVTPEPIVAYEWLAADQAIEGVGLWRSGEATLLDSGEPVRIGVYAITRDFPAFLGVRPLLGRAFDAEEVRQRAPVALVSEGLWKTRLGGRPDAVGGPLRLDDVVYTVVGVMPDRFAGFDGEDGEDEVWTPLARQDLVGMAGHVGALVRVREGATLEQASAELDRLARGSGEADSEWTYRAVPPQEFIGDNTRAGLLVLLGAVTVVLLIACANIAALLLVRLAGRRRDLAVRTALGAPRARLLGSLAFELLLLAALGCGAGLVMAAWSMDAIHALRPPQVDGLAALRLEGPVLAYAGALALATALLFGLAPAVSLLRRDMGSPFRAAMGSGDRVADGGRARAALVVGQIALSVALLAGAGLLVRTVVNLRAADVGFESKGLLTVKVRLPADRYPAATIPAFVRRATDALRAIPGVEGVTDVVSAPPELGITHGALQIEGQPEPEARNASIISAGFIGPDFARVLGARLVAGRDISAADFGAAPPSGDPAAGDPAAGDPVLVDRVFAEEHWPGQTAVGKRFRMAGRGEWNTVVGVIAEVAGNGPGRPRRGAIFYANSRAWEQQAFLVRVAGDDPTSLAPAIRQALADLDPMLAPQSIDSADRLLAAGMATERFLMVLLAAFAALAVLLSALGLYGLIAFSLARRTREIGIRLALGAAPADVRGLLLRQGALLTAAGTLLGLAGALAGARVLDGLLHGVQPRDPASFSAAALVIVLTALAASWLPARRATRVDPIVTLKAD